MAYTICYALFELCEVLPESHTIELCDFLKSIIRSEII